MSILTASDLPTSRPGGATRLFEGERYGFTPLSLFLTDVPTGGGASLHTHPYAEVFIVQEGSARFTLGAETTDVAAGRIVIVPPGVVHGFVSLGPERLRQISVHPSPKVLQTWLDQDETATAQATQAARRE